MFSRDPILLTVRIIRLALIAGVVGFGAVILFIHSLPNWKATTLPPAFGYAQVACAVVGIWAAIAMRGRVAGEPDPAQLATRYVTGWAIGEGAALFGGALFFITGQMQWYVLGLLAMAGAFAMLPIKARS
ncbi:MAG TPA: hypothetical protein VN651_14120 [Gemmatimonadaceae bacterium]|nr:hypothetical protein [Gemmatimonadaceae bacterium]